MTTYSNTLEARPGLAVCWLLAAPIRDFTRRSDGKKATVAELRDPHRLGNSLVLFVEGEASPDWKAITSRTAIAVTVEEVRSGKSRGELIETISRDALAAALRAHANGADAGP